MPKVIAIVGPTAIGKTKISIELARRLNLEIISGDSVAVYKRLDIGSAKPTLEEMKGVKHHLISVLDPTEQYDVEKFQTNARRIIEENQNVIICGGTGLYIKACLYNYEFEAPKRNMDFENEFKDFSNEELYSYLLHLDPNINQEKLHMNNRKRVLRAIEIISSTNKTLSEFSKKDEPIYDSYIIYLNINDRDKLYDRINKRVDKMVSDGLIEEAKALYDEKIYPHAIGYSELKQYFDKEITLESAIDLIKQNSRHLAKRQMTWFKNQMDTHFYEVNLENIDETIDKIYNDVYKFLN
jgi:tRNA dimethylallyltransferase